jgi:hypothetical protein
MEWMPKQMTIVSTQAVVMTVIRYNHLDGASCEAGMDPECTRSRSISPKRGFCTVEDGCHPGTRASGIHVRGTLLGDEADSTKLPQGGDEMKKGERERSYLNMAGAAWVPEARVPNHCLMF